MKTTGSQGYDLLIPVCIRPLGACLGSLSIQSKLDENDTRLCWVIDRKLKKVR
jgi:hypothetical protein